MLGVVADLEKLMDDDDLPQDQIDYFAVNSSGSNRGCGRNHRILVHRSKIADWDVYEGAPHAKTHTNNLEGFHNTPQSFVTQTLHHHL